jgi:hypothetical protein
MLIMIPVNVEVKEGEVFKGLTLIANQDCYTGAKISGIVEGDITIAKDDRCGEWYPSNVHVLVEKSGIVKGNIFADHVIIGGLVEGGIVAEYVTVLPGGRVEGDIVSYCKVEGEYVPPPFLKEFDECTDLTVLAIKELERRILN